MTVVKTILPKILSHPFKLIDHFIETHDAIIVHQLIKPRYNCELFVIYLSKH